MKNNLNRETRIWLFWIGFTIGGLISFQFNSAILGIVTFLILIFIETLVDSFDTNNRDE